MITEELIDRLVAATREAKEAVRECHEARRDLRLAIKEADERLVEIFEKVDYEAIGANLKKTLDRWLELLADAKDVLQALKEREQQLADPMSRFFDLRA